MTAQSSTEIVNGAWSAGLVAVTGILQAAPADRRLVRMTITGPSGSTFDVYRGFALSPVERILTTRKGSANTWESQGSEGWSSTTLLRGQSYTFAWTLGASGVGQTGRAVLYLEFD
jgi:hypothetical protein